MSLVDGEWDAVEDPDQTTGLSIIMLNYVHVKVLHFSPFIHSSKGTSA